jgi:hypothetical protein
MASRRKPGRTATHIREYKLRLPQDIAERIEAKAEVERCAQNRVIINELAAHPDLERLRKFAELVGDMENTLARYGSEIVLHQLSGDLLDAIDGLLKAEGDAVRAAVERVRTLRNAMLKTKAGKK